MKKIILILSIFIPIFVFAETSIRIIARVNDEVITSKDLDDFTKILSLHLEEDFGDGDLKQNALEKLIEDRLILNFAKKENFQIPNYLIEAKLNEIISNFNSREDFENSLIERGLTITKLKEQIKGQYLVRLALEKYVNSYIKISPSEILTFYKENPNMFVLPPKYKLWIAKSKNKNKLVELAGVIKKEGILYANEKYSDLLVNLEASKDDLRQELFEIINKMKENDLTIKKIDRIDYLIYLEKIVEGRKMTSDEAKDRALILLRYHKFKERYKEWIKELKDKALIKIYN